MQKPLKMRLSSCE